MLELCFRSASRFFLAPLRAELFPLSWTPLLGATCEVVSTSVKVFLPSLSFLHFPLTYLVYSASYTSKIAKFQVFYRSANRFSLAALGVELLTLSQTRLLGASVKTDSFMFWLSFAGCCNRELASLSNIVTTSTLLGALPLQLDGS